MFLFATSGLGYRLLTSFDDNTVDPDSQYGHSDNCRNKGVPLSRKLRLFRYVRHSPPIFPLTRLIVVDNRSSSLESSRGTRRSVSELRARTGPIPLSRMEGSVCTGGDRFPISQMSRPGSHISTHPHGRYKTHEVSLNVDMESGPEEK